MSRRVFTWGGRVCVAHDVAGARQALGLLEPDFIDPHDITEHLIDIADIFAPYDPELGQIRSLIVERDALSASLQARIDEIDGLKDRIALLEADAERAANDVAAALQSAEWRASAVENESTPIKTGNILEAVVGVAEPGCLPTGSSPPLYGRAATITKSSVWTPAADAELRRAWIAGRSPKQIAMGLNAIGVDVTPDKIGRRAYRIGLREADREVKLRDTRPTASASAASLPSPVPMQALAVTAQPAAPGLSRMASMHGQQIMALAGNLLSPDEIAGEINLTAKANDRVNAAQVRKVQTEMRALQKRGRA